MVVLQRERERVEVVMVVLQRERGGCYGGSLEREWRLSWCFGCLLHCYKTYIHILAKMYFLLTDTFGEADFISSHLKSLIRLMWRSGPSFKRIGTLTGVRGSLASASSVQRQNECVCVCVCVCVTQTAVQQWSVKSLRECVKHWHNANIIFFFFLRQLVHIFAVPCSLSAGETQILLITGEVQ